MMATMYDAGRSVSASWLSASFCSVHAAASSTSNTAKVTAKNCLRPYPIWDWKASCPSASHQFIGPVRREPGSKSKIRRHPPPLALLMELSEVRRGRPVRLGHSNHQFAEAATKLRIKDVFDAVRIFTHLPRMSA